MAGKYVLEIQGRENLSDTISADEIDLKLDFGNQFSKIKDSQPGYLWISALWNNSEYNLSSAVSYDVTDLDKKISSLLFFSKDNEKDPVDAKISSYDESSDSYQIVPEDDGTKLNEEKLKSVIEDAIKNLKDTVDLESEQCYVDPSVLSDDKNLNQICDTMNKYVSADITYDWNGSKEEVNGELISSWISPTSDNVEIDKDAVAAYVKEKASAHDTYGRKKTFTTVTGETKVLNNGGYGWKTDKEAVTEKLISYIEDGTVISTEPDYSNTAAQKGEDDLGNSYVEINLSAQHVYVIINGTVVFETDCVSGDIDGNCGTPAGVFDITYKEKDATLKGEDYESSVSYWMPFNGNIGMHDAVWRSEFGGDIYLTRGSHGCVNLPLASAAKIFDYVNTGFPVICYY